MNRSLSPNQILDLIQDESLCRNVIINEAENDIELFALHYFPDYCFRPFSEFHYWLFDKIQSDKKDKRIGVAAPRSFAKSTIMSFIFPIWVMAYAKKKYVLIISETATQASAFLNDIIVEVESNAMLRNDFPGLFPAIDEKNQFVKWTDTDIVLDNGTKVIARGTGAKLRGLKKSSSRPDLIILDDCEDDDMVLTYSRREKIKNWFNKVVMNVGDPRGCDVFVCGTILHYDALLKNILDRSVFDSQIFQAYTEIDGEDVPLWPEVWDMDKLMAKKEEIGILAFQSEYMNNPVEEETAIFKMAYFKFYEEITDLDRIYFGVDLAISQSTKADYTVIAAIGIKDNTYFVLDIFRKKIEFHDILVNIEVVADLWKPDKIGIEDVAFQKSVFQELVRTTKLPVEPIKVSKDKRLRARDLALYFSQGRVYVKRSMKVLIDEFLAFDSGRHDDIVDAVGLAVKLSVYDKPKKKKPLKVKNLDLKKLKGLKM